MVKVPFVSHPLLKVAQDLNPAVPDAHNPIQLLGSNGQVDHLATNFFDIEMNYEEFIMPLEYTHFGSKVIIQTPLTVI